MSKKIFFPFLNHLELTGSDDASFNFKKISEEQYMNRTDDKEFINLYNYDIIIDTYYFYKQNGSKEDRYHTASNFIPFIEVIDDQLPDLAVVSFLELIFDAYLYLFDYNQNEILIHSSAERMTSEGLRSIMRDKPDVTPPLIDLSSLEKLQFFIPLLKNNKAVSALILWRMSYQRDDSTDCVLDLCAALEAFFGVSDEHSLKVALFAYHYTVTDKYDTLCNIVELYKHRNNIIHGNSLTVIDVEDAKRYIKVVADIFKKAVITGLLPNSNELEKQVYAVYHS